MEKEHLPVRAMVGDPIFMGTNWFLRRSASAMPCSTLAEDAMKTNGGLFNRSLGVHVRRDTRVHWTVRRSRAANITVLR
jgi:hypothetical protein